MVKGKSICIITVLFCIGNTKSVCVSDFKYEDRTVYNSSSVANTASIEVKQLPLVGSSLNETLIIEETEAVDVNEETTKWNSVNLNYDVLLLTAEAENTQVLEETLSYQEEIKEELALDLQKTMNGEGTQYIVESGLRSEFKAYMSYRCVTTKSSPQYKYLNSEEAYTNEDGLRCYRGRCFIALGSYFKGEIGTKVDLVLTNGTIIQCIIGDRKSDNDTVYNHMSCANNGSVAEFIIDNDVFNSDGSGTVNFITTEKGSYDGKIAKIVIVE